MKIAARTSPVSDDPAQLTRVARAKVDVHPAPPGHARLCPSQHRRAAVDAEHAAARADVIEDRLEVQPGTAADIKHLGAGA